MRRSDKKANIAEANRLAEEAFMKEREMMGIPSPVKEEAPEAPEAPENQSSFDVDAAINKLVTNKTRGGVESMSGDEFEILFEDENFSLIVNCEVEVDEYPYFQSGGWNEPDEGSNGALDVTIVKGTMMVDKEDMEQDEITLTPEQLKPLEYIVSEIINDGDNLNDYFEKNTNEPDYDDYRDDDRYDSRAASKEWGGMDEEINEIKRITKRLLGE
jgi:hypothetical protein